MKKPRLTIYADSHLQYRWRLRGANGRILAASSESFTRRRDARRNVQRVFDTLTELLVVARA